MPVPIVDRLTSVPDVAPGPGFAHAVTATGRLAFVSGQVALDADGQLVGPGDLAAQTAQALRNLHGILRALGASWPDVHLMRSKAIGMRKTWVRNEA